MADAGVKLFLSCVSDEFGDDRDALRKALTGPDVEVKIQEDFKARGGDTLKMLEDYIGRCQAVVHVLGDMTGSTPAQVSVEDLLNRRPGLEAKLASRGLAREALHALTYTQWEAWLAICLGKDLLIVEPAAAVVRGPKFHPTKASKAAQARHRKRLRAINRYPGPPFTSADNLVAQINTRANRPSELGRGEEVLVTTQEATALYRALAKARPDAFGRNAATALSTLASILSDPGRTAEANAVGEEAAALRGG